MRGPLASRNAKLLPIFQQFTRDHPSRCDDVCSVPTVVAAGRRPADRAWHRHLPRDRAVLAGLSHAEICYSTCVVSRAGGGFCGSCDEAEGRRRAATDQSERGLVGGGAQRWGRMRRLGFIGLLKKASDEAVGMDGVAACAALGSSLGIHRHHETMPPANFLQDRREGATPKHRLM